MSNCVGAPPGARVQMQSYAVIDDGDGVPEQPATTCCSRRTRRSAAVSNLIGNPTVQTTLTLADGVRTTPALTYFQVRGVNSCHQEGP